MTEPHELRGWRAAWAFFRVRRLGPAALREIAGRWGDVVTLRLGRRRFCLVSDPDEATRVLRQNERNYTKSVDNRAVGEFLGTGLLTSRGETWQRHRRAAQGMFERAPIARLEQAIRRQCGRTLTALQAMPRDAPIRLHDEMSRLAFRIMCEALFASEDEAFDDVRGRFQIANDFVIKRARGLVAVPRWLPTPARVRFRKAVAWLKDFAAARVAARRAGAAPAGCLLESLLASPVDGGPPLPDDEIRDEILTLILGGYDTVGSSLAWALYLLARNPAWLERVRRDDAVVDLPTKPLLGAPECLVDQVFAEALRLQPPVWVLARQAVDRDVVGGREVTAGSTVLVSPYVLHRDRRWWDDVDAFRPDRFTLRTAFPPAFLPFGSGARQCLGMGIAFLEARIIIPAVVRLFDIVVDPAFDGGSTVSITLSPALGLPVRLRQRAPVC
jgi:cytochrome P450